MNQLPIEGIRVHQSHANRGMDFQAMLDKAHHYYETRGLGRVERRDNAWDFTNYATYAKTHPLKRALIEFTGRGGRIEQRFLIRSRSDVDYSGHLMTRYVAFDAKEEKDKSIPLDRFTRHQVEKLCLDERAKALAGFMVFFTSTGQIFWVSALKVREAQDRVMFQKKGKGKYPKSLSIAWMEENAQLLIVANPGTLMVDYLDKLIGGDK